MLAARNQARQQRGILNRAFERNDETVKEGTADTLKLAERMTPREQGNEMRMAADAAANRTMTDLRGSGADMIDTAGGGGRVSDNFTTAKAAAQGVEGDRLSAIAQEVGKVRAPGEVMGNEARFRAALAERLGSAFRSNQQRAQASQLDAQGVERPWYGDVGQLAAMVGGMSMGAGGQAAGAAPAADMGTMMAASADTAAPAFAASSTPSWMGQALGAYSRARKPTWMGR